MAKKRKKKAKKRKSKSRKRLPPRTKSGKFRKTRRRK